MNLKEHFQRWEEVFCFPCVNYECGICDRSLKEKKDCEWAIDYNTRELEKLKTELEELEK